MPGEYVPIVMFLCFAAVAAFLIVFGYRSRRDQQETLRHAISAGQQLDAETIALLAKPPRAPELDLRSGIIMAATALGALLSSALLWFNDPASDAPMVFAILGVLVGSLAIGQIVSWKVRQGLANNGASQAGQAS
jgi:Domain of unknown function (DUF6249)